MLYERTRIGAGLSGLVRRDDGKQRFVGVLGAEGTKKQEGETGEDIHFGGRGGHQGPWVC